MDRYLTKKAQPKVLEAVLENLAAAALLLLLAVLGIVAVYGFLEDGFVPVAHLMLLVIAAPVLFLLNRVLERKRARKHAEVIVNALWEAHGNCLPVDELEKITGVRSVEKTLNQLIAKGYLTGVTMQKGQASL